MTPGFGETGFLARIVQMRAWMTIGAQEIQAMPIYCYHCGNCDKNVDLLIGSSETAICPDCGSGNMERLLSRVAPVGKTRGLMKAARAQAGREGHLSNFSRAERGG
jgi:putative FmdB family regulatory protein